MHTVDSQLSGHPRGNGTWPLNMRWPLNRGSSGIIALGLVETSIYSNTNMLMATVNHVKTIINVIIFSSGHFLFQILICPRLFQNQAKLRVLNFVWPLNRGKDNRKHSSVRPKGGR